MAPTATNRHSEGSACRCREAAAGARSWAEETAAGRGAIAFGATIAVAGAANQSLLLLQFKASGEDYYCLGDSASEKLQRSHPNDDSASFASSSASAAATMKSLEHYF